MKDEAENIITHDAKSSISNGVNTDTHRLESLLTLTAVNGIGSVLYDRLIRHFGSIEDVFSASVTALTKVPRIGPKLAQEIKNAYRDELGKKELELVAKHNIKVVTYEDADYPANLKTIFDYPLLLYIKGSINQISPLAMGIVGTRRASYYGQNQSERLGYTLALRGFTVVSGLARGIDTAAHMGALKAKNGLTVAVLGSGFSRLYPPENKKLADRIAESGALVSELPLNSPPNSQNFPARNRIISGLSLGVVVVEAPLRSGALITADLALDQGREVFAIPGKIDSPYSQGCHRLIKQGAKLIETVDDIIDELPPFVADKLSGTPATKPVYSAKHQLDYKENAIVAILSNDEPKNIDTIVDETKLPPSIVSSTLLMLELKKVVKQLPGKNFVRMN